MAVQVANNISLLIYDNPNDSPRRINNPVLSVFDSSQELIQKGTVFTVKLSTFVENPPTTTQGIRDAAESRFNEYQRLILGNISNEYPYEIAAFFGFYNRVQPLFATSKYLNDAEFTNPALTAHQDPGYTTLNFTFAFINNAINLLMCPRSNFSNSESDNYPVSLLSIDSGFEILDSNVISIVADPTIWTRKNRGLVLSPKVQKIYSRYQNTSELILLNDYSYSSDSLTAGQIAYNAAFGWYFTENSTINRAVVLYSAVIDGAEYNTEVTIVLESDEPYSPGGNSGPGGGGGAYGKDEISDNISEDIPDGTVANDCRPSEMFTKYLCNSSYLDLVGEWLWADGDNLGLAIAQGVISKIFGSPSEALFELLSFPFNFSGHAHADRISGFLTWGNFTSNVPATILTDSGIKIDWGTIELSEYWGNFLDYSPHTKIELYLPWGTGFVSIDPGQCLPGTLQVITNVELSKGSCIHNVIGNDGCVIGTYAGQCGKQLPMSASDFASKVAGTVTAAAGAISVGAVAGASLASAASAYQASSPMKIGGVPVKYMGIERGKYSDYARFGTVDPSPYLDSASEATSRAGRLASKISSASLAVNRTPTHVSRNGGFTDGSSALGVQYPYIILSRPEQSIPENYGRYFGYPSNIYESIVLLKGYTEIGSIHLDGLGGALEPELVELENILKGGVIL